MSSNHGRARDVRPLVDVPAGHHLTRPATAAPAPDLELGGSSEAGLGRRSVAARRAVAKEPGDGCTSLGTGRPRGCGVLTPRERDVLGLMAQGASNTAVSEALHVSLKTVETYVQRIFCKLDLLENRDHNRRVKAVLIYLTTS